MQEVLQALINSTDSPPAWVEIASTVLNCFEYDGSPEGGSYFLEKQGWCLFATPPSRPIIPWDKAMDMVFDIALTISLRLGLKFSFHTMQGSWMLLQLSPGDLSLQHDSTEGW